MLHIPTSRVGKRDLEFGEGKGGQSRARSWRILLSLGCCFKDKELGFVGNKVCPTWELGPYIEQGRNMVALAFFVGS